MSGKRYWTKDASESPRQGRGRDRYGCMSLRNCSRWRTASGPEKRTRATGLYAVDNASSSRQLLKGGKKIFQNVGEGVANSTGTSEPS